MTKPGQQRKASKSPRVKLGLAVSLLSLAGLAGAFNTPLAPRGIGFLGTGGQHFLTPNGLERNIYFYVENDSCANASGKVFDIMGHQIAGMMVNPNCGLNSKQSLVWDGTGAQQTGVYLYEITVGDQAFTGTVVVIR